MTTTAEMSACPGSAIATATLSSNTPSSGLDEGEEHAAGRPVRQQVADRGVPDRQEQRDRHSEPR